MSLISDIRRRGRQFTELLNATPGSYGFYTLEPDLYLIDAGDHETVDFILVQYSDVPNDFFAYGYFDNHAACEDYTFDSEYELLEYLKSLQ